MNVASETFQGPGEAFLTTHWSVVLAAQGRSPTAREALEELCCSYWPPLCAFVQRQGYAAEEAKDLTQDFFARLLERRDFDTARKEKGRLRSYLLTSMKHFLANDRRRAAAIKRGEGQPLISLDEMLAKKGTDFELGDVATAEEIYERRWALTLLDQVMARLGDEFRTARKDKLFDYLKELLTDEPGRPPQTEIAQQLGMTESAVRQALHRLRERYREILREQIARTVSAPDEIDDELQHLIAVLRR